MVCPVAPQLLLWESLPDLLDVTITEAEIIWQLEVIARAEKLNMIL